MAQSQTLTPEVLWAQRSSATEAEKNHIFLTIMAPDVPESELKLDLQPTKLTFHGPSTSKKVTYAVDLEFYAEIDPKESKINHTARDIEMVLRKKELKAEYWPRLLKDSKRQHFLKTNFDKWVDEDEQEEAAEDDFSAMNPLGDGGMGGIDFSKLTASQSTGGLPDLGAMGGEGGDSDDDLPDDEDMPELEGDSGKPATEAEADKAAEGESKPKIEEVA
ncbi:HSP20-like chaperone [Westerdykella ornata]|uniref:HSP20-like chaperone n=1 Tax=Westerdykella ornata TaxID=318751 RepID=A0A6A6J862_WESOR|nr:HSP20-like chaperone [Westerdykella ornata]KAF2272555.1 HSP20-like chaperone [Westerdykella ornata]